MKKILFSILSLLCCMTAAWAGEGNGTKEHPFTGEWQASKLGPMLEPGQYLSFDCVIKDGGITVVDTKLNNQEVAKNWPAWAPGNLIDNPQDGSPYKNYGADNPSDRRKKQSFILTDVSPSAKTSTSFTITGYFNGFYRGVPEADGFYNVYTAKQMRTVLQAAADANVRLTEDVYMSDLGEGESGRHTLCSTFKGTLDGGDHTIWAARPEIQHDGGGHYHRQYLFTYCDGATIKYVTLRDFRVQSDDNYNQAILTSQARNKCYFRNIAFDNVSVFGDENNVGAAAGWVEDCTFSDITVRNSDFTTDGDQSGCVVGHAINSYFTNITVENSNSLSDDEKSGGVAARADDCTFLNCSVDSKSSIFTDGQYVGGIVGYATSCTFRYCINYAVVGSRGFEPFSSIFESYAGGIVGNVEENKDKDVTIIESCINAGPVIPSVKDIFFEIVEKHKNSGFNQSTIKHAGKTYTIQKIENYQFQRGKYIGGIVGSGRYCDINDCANMSPTYCYDNAGGIGGNLYYSNVDCCVNYGDYSRPVGNNSYGGIASWCGLDTSITNCMNVGLSFPYLVYQIGDCEIKNCLNTIGINEYRYDTGPLSDHDFVNNYNKNNITPNMLASGEICAKLGAAWEQNLGTDPYPTPTGNKGLYFASELYSEFNSICLPFAVNSDEKVQCYKPQSAGYSEDKTIYYIKLAPVDGLLAGEPGFCRVLEPGSTYTFGKADGETYQFTPQEYAIPVEPSASGDDPDMSWTMSGALQGPSTFHNDTNYGNIDRRMMYSEMVWANAAYIKGPSYINTFTDGNPVNGTPIYIVSSTSPYDVNFDDAVDVADVISYIGMDDNFTPFVSGSREDNLNQLTQTILGK